MRRHIVDDLAPARASRLATRADTLRNMRRAVAIDLRGGEAV
jgi:hypothetical protein